MCLFASGEIVRTKREVRATAHTWREHKDRIAEMAMRDTLAMCTAVSYIENTPVTTAHTHAHVLALLATRTTCTTRASPVRSRCRRAHPCGSRPAAAADPTPRRPSGRASPPRRPTPAPRSSTCVESKAARASAGWLFGGGLQRQSVPQAAPKRANPRGASTTALLTTTALDHGPALHQGPAPRPCTMARLST